MGVFIIFRLSQIFKTNTGQYGENFLAEIKLDKFINLDTGEWK